MHIVVFSSENLIHIMRPVSFWQKSNFSILNSFYNEICSCFKQLMFTKLLKSEIILSRCHYHIIPKGSKTSLNVCIVCVMSIQSFIHTLTHTLQRTQFTCLFFVKSFFPSSMFAWRLCLCCRLPSHMSLLSRSIQYDDAYSYRETILSIYVHIIWFINVVSQQSL